MHHILPSLLLLLTFCAATAFAQNGEKHSEGTVRITLVDGSTVVGTLEQENETEIVLLTSSGITMTIPRAKIERIVSVEGQRFTQTDPNRTRLFFAPTARPLPSGSGYLAVYEIFAPFVAVGAGDILTLAGGVTINPGTGRLVYAAPKVTLMNQPSVSLAVGGLGVAVVGDGSSETAGLLFGVTTLGQAEASLSLGLAFGYSESKFGSKPVVMVGGEYQVLDHFKLLTENYLFLGVDEGVLVSGGVRFFGDQLAADLGLFTMPELIDNVDGFPFLPWLGFAYNFGR